MSVDVRFYRTSDKYQCPQCRLFLHWRHRPGTKDSMMLVHEDNIECPNEGKSFYAPVVSLTEIPVNTLKGD